MMPQILAHAQCVGEPCVREFEREAGDDENDEAGEQDEVLPALIDGHARHEGVHRAAAGDSLGAPDDGVVQEHGADNEQDEGNVNPPDPTDGDGVDVGGARAGLKMDGRARELLRDAFVALAAGGVEIGAIDGGVGVA